MKNYELVMSTGLVDLVMRFSKRIREIVLGNL